MKFFPSISVTAPAGVTAPAVLFLGLLCIASAMPTPVAAQKTATEEKSAKADKQSSETSSKEKSKTPWVSLKGSWKACQFGGEGDVSIKEGVITMEYGEPLTGVVWTGPFEGDEAKKQPKDGGKVIKPLPRDNYEIRWQCKRDKGYDFLCAFTFPIADQYASLVMGGWGGGITGISSIDGQDASDNDTTMFKNYDDKRWYNARVRVETQKITVWIDGKEMFDQPRKDHEFDIRFEMDPCTPMGIANFECDSQIRNIEIRRLHASEIASADEDDE